MSKISAKVSPSVSKASATSAIAFVLVSVIELSEASDSSALVIPSLSKSSLPSVTPLISESISNGLVPIAISSLSLTPSLSSSVSILFTIVSPSVSRIFGVYLIVIVCAQ